MEILVRKKLYCFLVFLSLLCLSGCNSGGGASSQPNNPIGPNNTTCIDVDKYSKLNSFNTGADYSYYSHPIIVESAELEYGNCNSSKTLQQLFEKVTADAQTDMEKGQRWVTYLQEITFHSPYIPVDQNGAMVMQPMWLLEHKGMQCGQVARLMVDGFTLAGIKARVVQLNGHQTAEFWADGKWRYAEADILGDSEFVRNNSGEIVSIEDVANDINLLNSIHPYPKSKASPVEKILSYSFLSEDSRMALYKGTFIPNIDYVPNLPTPYVIQKSIVDLDLYPWLYGWGYYKLCSLDGIYCV